MRMNLLLLAMILQLAANSSLAASLSICNPGSPIKFYPNGQLESCSLNDTYLINGLRCALNSLIIFYPGGELKSCVATNRAAFGAVTCNEHATIEFHESGRLQMCMTVDLVKIDQGAKCAPLATIMLFEDGTMKYCSNLY